MLFIAARRQIVDPLAVGGLHALAEARLDVDDFNSDFDMESMENYPVD